MKKQRQLDYTSKRELYELYWGDERSKTELARVFGVSTTAITTRLSNEGIPQVSDAGHSAFVTAMIPKRVIYEYYWGQDATLKTAADELGVSRYQLGRRCRRDGIPTRPNDSRASWILKMRPRRRFFEWHWTDSTPLYQIADEQGVGQVTVRNEYTRRGVPINSAKNRTPDAEITKPYQWPDDRASEDNGGELPDDPDPAKYMAETPIYADKQRLYELYWGYGLSAAHIRARCRGAPDIKQRMRNMGIPTRNYHQHTRWAPHHGVPPKYEWPEDDEWDSD